MKKALGEAEAAGQAAEEMNPQLDRKPLDYPPPPSRNARPAAFIELAITLAVFTARAVLAPAFAEAFGRLR